MKAKLPVILALISTMAIAQTPAWQWAKRVGSFNDNYALATGDQNERFNDIKVDAQGNVYAVGEFFQNSAFNNTTTGFPTTGGYGERDAYLMKFNKCGKTLWWRRMGGAAYDAAVSLVLDGSGKVIISGYCAPTFTLGGNNITNSVITNGSVSPCIVRFDTAGNYIDRFSGNGLGGKIFITSQGDYFIVAGGIAGVRVNTLGITTAIYNYVTGVSQNWVNIKGITMDKSDNVYLSGFITNTAVIGGTPVTYTNVPPGQGNSVIAKFSPAGTLLWVNSSNPSIGTGADVLGKCTVDTSGTYLLTGGVAALGVTVFGYTVSSAPSSPPYANVFYRFDTNTGNLLSATVGSISAQDFISPLYTDKNNRIHCAGTVAGSLAFNTATYTTNPASNTRQSCIGIYDIVSNTVSVNMLPQSGSNAASIKEQISSLVGDAQGNIYVCGMFGGILDSLGTSVNIIGGAEDGFVAKYGYACPCAASSATISPAACNSYTSPSGNHVWSASGSYQDTLVNSTGCDSLIIVNLTINQNPVVSANSGAICKGQSFTITASGAATYTYSGGSAVVSPAANTTYTVTGANTQGCIGTALSTITVNPLPPVGISGTVAVICEGESITLNATGAGSYTWNSNVNGNSLTLSPTTTTAYSVTGTDANGCENTAVVTQAVDPCTGIKQLTDFDEELNIYPNPGNGQITIELPEDAQTVITDALGRIVYNKRLKAGVQSIEIKEAANGIYFVKVTTTEKQFVRQIVIER